MDIDSLFQFFDDKLKLPVAANAPAQESRAAPKPVPPAGVPHKQIIMAAFHAAPVGLTDEEGSDLTGIRMSGYGPRRLELVRAGKLVDSGERRPTKSGLSAIVWRST